MMSRRLIDPSLACAETDVEIIHARGRTNRAFEPFVFTCDDARGPYGRNRRGLEILALRLGKLELGRQWHPKLEALGWVRAGASAPTPKTTRPARAVSPRRA